jgi:type IV pilus assembly protein PilB
MSSQQSGQTTQVGRLDPFSNPPGLGNIATMASETALAVVPAPPPPRLLGERLVASRVISEGQLRRALDLQATNPRFLGAVLLELGLIDEDRLIVKLSEHLQVPIADLRSEAIDGDAAQRIPAEFARRHVVLSFREREGELAVAMEDPGNLHLVNDIRLITGVPIRPHIAGRSDILANLSRVHSMKPRIDEAARSLEESRPQYSAGRSMVFELSSITASSPAVDIVNMLITQGLRDRASDIHVEPQKDFLRIRFRIDGVLQDVAHLPSATGAAVASRIKIMASMNIVERRRAQDGQISLTVDGRDLDVRVATIETIWGEKLVLRLLDRRRSLIALRQLGFSREAYERFHAMLHSPYGMIIVSGPTGSGKTTTLYAKTLSSTPSTTSIRARSTSWRTSPSPMVFGRSSARTRTSSSSARFATARQLRSPCNRR